VRQLHLPLVQNLPVGIDGVGGSVDLRLHTPAGEVYGSIVAVPDLAPQLLEEQARALELEVRAARVAIADGASVIGLGNALAVVAGRGKELAERVPIPVTTGQTATAWACAAIVREALGGRRPPIGVIGFAGTVGDAVAAALRDSGHEVWVAAEGGASIRRAQALGCQVEPMQDLLRRCRWLVGASTTGPVLRPDQLAPDTTLIDVALPPTLAPGPRPRGVREIKGEVLRAPGPIHGGFWGRIWLTLADYGRGCVYACLAEPAAMALTGEIPPGLGRRIEPDRLARTGAVLTRLGFVPVLRSVRRR
jgi:predicted amino acid dehydrogenase